MGNNLVKKYLHVALFFAVIFGCLGILSAIVENAYENMYYVAAILLVFVGFFALFGVLVLNVLNKGENNNKI